MNYSDSQSCVRLYLFLLYLLDYNKTGIYCLKTWLLVSMEIFKKRKERNKDTLRRTCRKFAAF